MSAVARRYALAAVEAADEQGGLGAVDELALGLRAFRATYLDCPELHQLVTNPALTDRRTDVLRDIGKNSLEVLYRQADGEWKTGMRFKVFEKRTFERANARAPEPREIVTAELTGDGLTDIAITVHDRVVVYPQQGRPAEE